MIYCLLGCLALALNLAVGPFGLGFEYHLFFSFFSPFLHLEGCFLLFPLQCYLVLYRIADFCFFFLIEPLVVIFVLTTRQSPD